MCSSSMHQKLELSTVVEHVSSAFPVLSEARFRVRARLRTAVPVVSAASLDQLPHVFGYLLYDVNDSFCLLLLMIFERERAQGTPLPDN